MREHLELFARIKGVSSDELEAFVQKMMRDLDLKAHEGKVAAALSGGNKRKLGVGIALIGGPVLVFLDEPSTGVDPGTVFLAAVTCVLDLVRQYLAYSCTWKLQGVCVGVASTLADSELTYNSD